MLPCPLFGPGALELREKACPAQTSSGPVGLLGIKAAELRAEPIFGVTGLRSSTSQTRARALSPGSGN